MVMGRERQPATWALVVLGFAAACSGSRVDDESLPESSESTTPSAAGAKSAASKPDDADRGGSPPEAPRLRPPTSYDPRPPRGSDSDDAGLNAAGSGAAGAAPVWCEGEDDLTPVPLSCGVISTTTAYRANQLGLLSDVSRQGSSSSQPRAFNNHGVVVGDASLCDQNVAFIYRDGEMLALEIPPKQFHNGSSAKAVNDEGDVLGTSDGKPFITRDGIATELAGFTASDSVVPEDINNVGQVLGSAREGAFVWDAGEITYLGDSLSVSAINDQGQVAGSLQGGGAFVWEGGVMTMLPDLPGGSDTYAWDINEAGQVVGGTYVSEIGHAVLWENGVAYDITPPVNGTLERAYAVDINDQGAVLGYLQQQTPDLNSVGFLFDHGAVTYITAEAPFTDVTPVALNDAGDVLGRSLLFNGPPGQATVWSQGCFDACCD